MKGVLDILHAWKNVLNKSFEQKREYRFIATSNINTCSKIAKEYALVVYTSDNIQKKLDLTKYDGASISVDVGTEVVFSWDQSCTYLTVNGIRIV